MHEMSDKNSIEKNNDEKVPVGNVKSVLTAIEDDFDSKNAAALLADSHAKREEAIMCLRLIAGLNPMLREKAEQTIEELSKLPLPAPEGH